MKCPLCGLNFYVTSSNERPCYCDPIKVRDELAKDISFYEADLTPRRRKVEDGKT